ncbi:hypothetical protein H8959_007852 [Pygathrix nigripes]
MVSGLCLASRSGEKGWLKPAGTSHRLRNLRTESLRRSRASVPFCAGPGGPRDPCVLSVPVGATSAGRSPLGSRAPPRPSRNYITGVCDVHHTFCDIGINVILSPTEYQKQYHRRVYSPCDMASNIIVSTFGY